MECSYDKTDSAVWKEVIPNRPDVLLEGVDEFKDFLVIIERKNGLRQMNIKNITSGKDHYIDFGEPAYSANPAANPEFNSTTLRYNYTSSDYACFCV